MIGIKHEDRGGVNLSSHEGEILVPIATTYGPHVPPPPPPLHQQYSIVPYTKKKKAEVVVRYAECLKNHVASIGGFATDGCCEFMPSGEEGTVEALKCSACGCHRSFHRKEIEGETSSSSVDYSHYQHLHRPRKVVGHNGVLISGHPPMIMPLGALQASESEDMEGVVMTTRSPMEKKRFRTKFTLEQKEKMVRFAEKVGWKLQKLEEDVVHQFCQEIGVKRRVLKVWMHNNKNSLGKNSTGTLQHGVSNELIH